MRTLYATGHPGRHHLAGDRSIWAYQAEQAYQAYQACEAYQVVMTIQVVNMKYTLTAESI
jgi:hypothetical protein